MARINNIYYINSIWLKIKSVMNTRTKMPQSPKGGCGIFLSGET